jgi:hypothetical protein
VRVAAMHRNRFAMCCVSQLCSRGITLIALPDT